MYRGGVVALVAATGSIARARWEGNAAPNGASVLDLASSVVSVSYLTVTRAGLPYSK